MRHVPPIGRVDDALSPTKAYVDPILSGPALRDISNPMAQTPRGGIESGFDGSNGFVAKPTAPEDGAAASPFAGLGPWLEDADADVYQRANELVLRQELIAEHRLAIDTHYTRIKLGFPFSTLERDPARDTCRAVLPAGTKALTIQAVPNKAWDLINKATETLLVDPAQPHPTPLNDSEEAEQSADMAERFLEEDAGEHGTNDIALFYDGVDRALSCATSYLEGWVDPVGGGYVPLQILAHPQAVDPANPLVGPDGNPTVSPVLRYVTAPDGGQFTTKPSEAAPQWQPKIRGRVWGREHWRVFPESESVSGAEKVIGLLYCTVGEAKRRWPDVAAMDGKAIDALLSWTPPRYLVLLPPFQRARWKLSGGSDKEKAGSSDERVLFYYRVLQTATPDHPKGAEVIISGANSGTILNKGLLATTVQVPTSDGSGRQDEVRCLDLPLVQITPRRDPDERDPTGRCFLEMFAGATEANAALVTGFLEALDLWLHPDSYVPSTSSVEGFQVEESRATGDAIPILRPEDKPIYGNQPPLPSTFWNAIEFNDRATDSISSLNKPVTGADNQQEVSGKARQIAVQQAMVGLNRMQQPINAAHERWYRIKLQLAMRDYSTPQMIRYVGEDGAYKEREWTGTDFALVGDVGIQAGTGTMMPPDQKVNYIATIAANGMIPPDEAADAARPSFAKRVGLADDPHQQYIERCVSTWLDGPPQSDATPDPMTGQPKPDWATQWRAYQQQQQQYAAVSQGQAQQQAAMQAQGAPVIALAPPMPAPVAPWTPFQPRANDSEPPLAMKWMKRLSRVISSAKYDAMPPEWRQCLDQRYQLAVQVVQLATAPVPQPQPAGGAKPPAPDASQPSQVHGVAA